MLQPATAPISAAQVEREAREPIPDSIPRHGRDGRPRIRHADDPTQMSFLWRPSSFGDGIESTFMLDRRADRLVVAGAVRFPHLIDEAAAVLYPQGEEPGDWDEHLADKAVKDELHRIRAELLTRMGAEDRAARGTELHGYRDRLDRGESLPFLGPEMWAALHAWSRIACRFTWHGSEQFVVCDKYGTAGTYDALWSPKTVLHPPYGPPVEPGQRLVVDLKSGAWVLRYGEIGRTIQLTQYPNGVPYVHVPDEDAAVVLIDGQDMGGRDNGRREWPDGVAPRTDWALIPHVPLDSPQDAGLLWVDLTKGAQILDMPIAKRWEVLRMVGSLILPAELPAVDQGVLAEVDARFAVKSVRQSVTAGCDPQAAMLATREAAFDRLRANRERLELLTAIREVRLPDSLARLYEQNRAIWTDEHGAAADERLAELSSLPVA